MSAGRAHRGDILPGCKLRPKVMVCSSVRFSPTRHERFPDSDSLGRVFEGVAAICIAAGLVGGEAFSVDARPDQPIALPKAK